MNLNKNSNTKETMWQTKDVAVFDLDGTLINSQSQYLFLKFLIKRGYVQRYRVIPLFFWFLMHRLGIVDSPNRAFAYALKIFRDINFRKLTILAKEFTKSVLIECLNKEIVDILREHQKNKDCVVLISTSLDILVSEIAVFLEIEIYESTNIKTKDDKINTIEPLYGKSKVQRFEERLRKEGIKPLQLFVYTDNTSDIPLLSMATYPTVVDPKSKLERHATKNSWQIIKLT
ncbi:MAG: HAD-IB family hydrolase [bacterium]|nr:HAD-IB family hydrolase [bacterium]